MKNNEKKLNREATIQNILNKCNSGIGMTIDVAKFNERIKEADSNEFIIDAAGFCGTEVVYE
jgi:hypothetical protein